MSLASGLRYDDFAIALTPCYATDEAQYQICANHNHVGKTVHLHLAYPIQIQVMNNWVQRS